MFFIGSKKSLLDFLEKSIYQIVGKKNFTFLDLFAWTGIVGQHFKAKWHKVIANDFLYFCYILNKNYIENNKILKFKNLENDIKELKNIPYKKRSEFICNYLDNLELKEWFIYNNYCLGGTKNKKYQRLYFSDENGKKIDTIRQKIEEWKNKNKINENEYYFLLATLIENADKIANTASVYWAFLKKLKKSAQKTLTMQPAYFTIDNNNHKVYNENIEILIEKVEWDVLYLDPPYNTRQYIANYHLLETIARYDNPKIKGKTWLREYKNQKSKFSQKKEVLKAFENIIQKAKAKYIFVSYNNEGILTEEQIRNIMSKRGKYWVFKKEYSRFKSDKTKNRNYKANSVIEYLHYVECK